jgi:hypothetical protein
MRLDITGAQRNPVLESKMSEDTSPVSHDLLIARWVLSFVCTHRVLLAYKPVGFRSLLPAR